MKQIVPDYYKNFTCIADRCRHSCCIGWEIDIDSDTYDKYKNIPGEFGDRLRDGISEDEVPYFRLGEGDRCPFLNERGLCDIILTLGEDALCGICSDHPRFRNFYESRTEIGLGLTCEEAARLILGQTEPMKLAVTEDDGIDQQNNDDELFFAERDHVIEVLQDRELTLAKRFNKLAEEYGICDSASSPAECAEFYRSLERLDPLWDGYLDRLSQCDSFSVPEGNVWENLAVYIIYRHSADYGVSDSTAFALHTAKILSTIATDDFDKTCDICRMWSSEIEYSVENTEAIIENLNG